MLLYRIVKSRARTHDLSGTGAFNEGGRWNSEGVYVLYTSENSSLAHLELLVHADKSEIPPKMFIITIEVDDSVPVISIADEDMPTDWRIPENIQLKQMGDDLLKGNQYIAIRARSAANPMEYNYILNPKFPNYYNLVKVVNVQELDVDDRLIESS